MFLYDEYFLCKSLVSLLLQKQLVLILEEHF